MSRFRRGLLIGSILGLIPSAAGAEEVRPTICVFADLSDPGARNVREKLSLEARDHTPEEVIAGAAVRSLSAIKLFDFTTLCPASTAKPRLRIVLVSEDRGWPTTELRVVLVLDIPGQGPREVALGIALKAQERPESFRDASWLRRCILEPVARWDDDVRRFFGVVPIIVNAVRTGNWVRINASYRDLNLGPDQVVLSTGSKYGVAPDVLFRLCEPDRPSGPLVNADSRLHCDQLHDAPAGTSVAQSWPRIFLWRFSGAL